jgi:hypothetical protein
MFEYNIILSRFLNWPDTLESIGFRLKHDPDQLLSELNDLARCGKIWGGAYVITTHGIPMPKATYLCQNVLEGVWRGLDGLRSACRGASLGAAAQALQGFEGIGSFLAGQVVADLKNTVGHPLHDVATDRLTFVVPGPGSLRGVGWFWNGEPKGVSERNFLELFKKIRSWVDTYWDERNMGPPICNQDLQNCLCEFDKYMRVKNGTGRSKRGYNGT